MSWHISCDASRKLTDVNVWLCAYILVVFDVIYKCSFRINMGSNFASIFKEISSNSFNLLRTSISFYFQKQSPQMFHKIGVLKNFAIFTGKQLRSSLCCNKVAGLRLANLLKKRLWHRCFPVNFAKFLRTAFSQNTSERLFQYISALQFSEAGEHFNSGWNK